MRFTKLRLNGFKSFVDPTDLVIHQGLTGVVGPNGCGKSNLLEALRWVMGENRPTAMRGDGMEDVIFNGAATRGARHFAEVALVIDNSERLAPSGFNEADQIEIVRRITRDIGSAYKTNGKEARARDVQMLFADASTGSHSPALVRQGQISELINARPKSRRRILEEAAGISGLYQRRHEAELKLQSTEVNLARIDDVLESLAQQLSVLVRQAKQAERYREIADELRRCEGMLLYRLWREADVVHAEAEVALRGSLLHTSQVEAVARAVMARRNEAEESLPPLREEEAVAGAILQRLQLQRDALTDEEQRAAAVIATLTARDIQLANDMAREAGLNRDAGETISQLEWELDQLAKGAEGHEARLAGAAEIAAFSAAELSGRESGLSTVTEDTARLAARHQSAIRLIGDTRQSLERAQTETDRVRRAEAEARASLATASAAEARSEADLAEAQALLQATETALVEAETARSDTQVREAEARARRSGAEGEANAMRAEVEALARLVEREARVGSQLLDRLEVTPGYEKALGAALADDLRAPLIEGNQRTGWVALAAYATDQSLPDGVEPLSARVAAQPVLQRRLSQVGLVARDKARALQGDLRPGQRLVSREGDLWRWDGYSSAAEDATSTAALRLEQLNRLVVLKRDLEDATARAAGALQAHDALQARLADLTRADQMAREARRAADQRLSEAQRALSRVQADKSVAGGKLEAAEMAALRFQAEAADARTRLAEAEAGLAGLADLDAARAMVDAAKIAVEAARLTMLTRRSAHDELRREGDARLRRKQDATTDLSGWRHRQQTAAKRSEELAERHSATEAELTRALAVPAELSARRLQMADAIEVAEARRRKAADVLAEGEAALRSAQDHERQADRAAGEAREARARDQARIEAALAATELAGERIRQEAECEPPELLIRLRADPDNMPDAAHLETEVGRLRRQREALGAVNLRAAEDAQAVEAEYDALATEKVDLEEAVKKLRAGIAGLNREGRERLLTAFEQVNANFSTLFTHLFGGGEARLVMVESDDPLEAGLEIMCQPPGKRLSTLSLLSGGEQTLTALALIFAVFLANPAPICVLDEVDAPLDDANVTRFCDLLDEMTRRTDTRFLIITHHAVTMSRMDRLYGVTMAEQGVSQLVSVDLKRAEALVA